MSAHRRCKVERVGSHLPDTRLHHHEQELCPLPDEDSLNAELNGRFTALSLTKLEHAAAPVAVSGNPRSRAGSDRAHVILKQTLEAVRPRQAAIPRHGSLSRLSQFHRGIAVAGWLDLQWTIGDVPGRSHVLALRQTWLRWLGLSRETGAHSGGTYLSRFASYIAEAEFADVNQGFHDTRRAADQAGAEDGRYGGRR